jgi:hypothetical protein
MSHSNTTACGSGGCSKANIASQPASQPKSNCQLEAKYVQSWITQPHEPLQAHSLGVHSSSFRLNHVVVTVTIELSAHHDSHYIKPMPSAGRISVDYPTQQIHPQFPATRHHPLLPHHTNRPHKQPRSTKQQYSRPCVCASGKHKHRLSIPTMFAITWW